MCLTKYATLNPAVIDIEESHFKGFKMVEQLLRETTSFSKGTSDKEQFKNILKATKSDESFIVD